MNLKPILQSTLEDYALPLGGDHGVAHWARVLENGLRLTDETIKWADGRASFGVIPTFVLDEWGIDVEKERAW